MKHLSIERMQAVREVKRIAARLDMPVLMNLGKPHGFYLETREPVPELEQLVNRYDQQYVTSIREEISTGIKYICYVW